MVPKSKLLDGYLSYWKFKLSDLVRASVHKVKGQVAGAKCRRDFLNCTGIAGITQQTRSELENLG